MELFNYSIFARSQQRAVGHIVFTEELLTAVRSFTIYGASPACREVRTGHYNPITELKPGMISRYGMFSTTEHKLFMDITGITECHNLLSDP